MLMPLLDVSITGVYYKLSFLSLTILFYYPLLLHGESSLSSKSMTLLEDEEDYLCCN